MFSFLCFIGTFEWFTVSNKVNTYTKWFYKYRTKHRKQFTSPCGLCNFSRNYWHESAWVPIIRCPERTAITLLSVLLCSLSWLSLHFAFNLEYIYHHHFVSEAAHLQLAESIIAPLIMGLWLLKHMCKKENFFESFTSPVDDQFFFPNTPYNSLFYHRN